MSDTGTPAILSNGTVPSLNAGITAVEVRSLIGAGTSSTTGTVTSVATGGGLTGGTITTSGTISHADTSSQASVNNSTGTVIQDVTLDDYGHVTGLASVNLDGRYYTEAECETIFVNVAGDTMTGDLNMYENGAYSSELTFQNNTHKIGIDYENNETLRFITRSGTTTVPITFHMRAGTIIATNFVLSSDERKKTKIKDLSGDNVDVNWKSFEMKNNEGEYRVGVIAQELEIKHPEFVNTDGEGFKSVKYIDLLIAKIAELEARLEKAGI